MSASRQRRSLPGLDVAPVRLSQHGVGPPRLGWYYCKFPSRGHFAHELVYNDKDKPQFYSDSYVLQNRSFRLVVAGWTSPQLDELMAGLTRSMATRVVVQGPNGSTTMRYEIGGLAFVVRCELEPESFGMLRTHIARSATETVDAIASPLYVSHHVNHIYFQPGQIHLPLGRLEAKSHAGVLITVHCEQNQRIIQTPVSITLRLASKQTTNKRKAEEETISMSSGPRNAGRPSNQSDSPASRNMGMGGAAPPWGPLSSSLAADRLPLGSGQGAKPAQLNERMFQKAKRQKRSGKSSGQNSNELDVAGFLVEMSSSKNNDNAGEDDEDGSSDSSSQGGHRFDAMFGNGGSLRGQMHPPIMSPQALLGHGIAFAGPGTNTQGRMGWYCAVGADSGPNAMPAKGRQLRALPVNTVDARVSNGLVLPHQQLRLVVDGWDTSVLAIILSLQGLAFKDSDTARPGQWITRGYLNGEHLLVARFNFTCLEGTAAAKLHMNPTRPPPWLYLDDNGRLHVDVGTIELENCRDTVISMSVHHEANGTIVQGPVREQVRLVMEDVAALPEIVPRTVASSLPSIPMSVLPSAPVPTRLSSISAQPPAPSSSIPIPDPAVSIEKSGIGSTDGVPTLEGSALPCSQTSSHALAAETARAAAAVEKPTLGASVTDMTLGGLEPFNVPDVALDSSKVRASNWSEDSTASASGHSPAEVHSIVDHRLDHGRLRFLVRWVTGSNASWELPTFFVDAPGSNHVPAYWAYVSRVFPQSSSPGLHAYLLNPHNIAFLESWMQN